MQTSANLPCYGLAMIRYDGKLRTLALCFAGLAGFVDAIGFLKSGGLFVSFMSGNSTQLAVGITQLAGAGAAAGLLIALFVFGVVLNSLLGVTIVAMDRKVTAAIGVACLLATAAIFQSLDWDIAAIGTLCVAMGASNTIFQRDGEVSIGVTYMTGTLVKLGQRIADALRGENRGDWIAYLLLWLALVMGGIAGTIGFAWSATASLWLAAGFAAILAETVRRLTKRTAA